MKTLHFYLTATAVLLMSAFVSAQTMVTYTTADGLPDDFIIGGVTFNTDGHVWIGTSYGVGEFDGTSWETYFIADGLADDYIKCIEADVNGNIWVGTDLGLSMYNGTAWTTYTTNEGLVDNSITALACESDGSVWVGTLAGVSHFYNNVWTTFNTGNGFPSDLITTIHIDDAGNKYFGTWELGVIKYDGTNYTLVDTADGLLDQYVTAIETDLSGNLLVGSLYGISRFNSSLVWTDTLTQNTGLYNNYIMDIEVSSAGYLWVSMFVDYLLDGGVSWFNGSIWTSYNTADGIADPLVKKIGIDSDGNVWVCTGTGLTKISDYVTIESAVAEKTPAFYPNPASDRITFGNEVQSVTLYDMAGRCLQKSGTETTMDISSLPGGWYSLEILDRNGMISREPLCIQK